MSEMEFEELKEKCINNLAELQEDVDRLQSKITMAREGVEKCENVEEIERLSDEIGAFDAGLKCIEVFG